MKRPTASAGGGSAADTPLDEQFAKKHPTIWLYLTDLKWDDGTPRVPSAVTLFVDDGAVKATLADKDLQRSLYVSADSVQQALAALEKALAGSSPDWKKWGRATKRK